MMMVTRRFCLTVRMWYQIIVAPVEDLLDGSELIVVPEGLLYRVTLAALEDSSRKHLFETYKVRVIPFLTDSKANPSKSNQFPQWDWCTNCGRPWCWKSPFTRKGGIIYVSRLSSAKEVAENQYFCISLPWEQANNGRFQWKTTWQYVYNLHSARFDVLS